MAVRDDYFLRFITLLRQAIAQMVQLRTTGRPLEALEVARQTQEKLFARPTAKLAVLSLDEMLRLLRLDEPPDEADRKIAAYGMLLRETGLLYAAMDRTDSAQSCFQLALQVLLTVGTGSKPPAEETRETMRDLLGRIPPEQLHAPVREMLGRFAKPA